MNDHPAFAQLRALPHVIAVEARHGRRDDGALMNAISGLVVRQGLTSDSLLGEGSIFRGGAARAALFVSVGQGPEASIADEDAWQLVRAWRHQAASLALPLPAERLERGPDLLTR